MTRFGLRNDVKKGAFTLAHLLTSPLSRAAKRVYELGLGLELKRDWETAPNPEWFNHELDLAMFTRWRKPHFFERGVYASEVVTGKRVLDLCCGDGSVAALFVSPLAASVLSIDFDPSAIRHARAAWSDVKNVRYEVGDIRRLGLAEGSFDVCLWDAAIEHFTQEEMRQVMSDLKKIIGPAGLLHGSTIERTPQAGHHEHEYEFATLEELRAFLSTFFRHVAVWERRHPDRTSYYFRCSETTSELRGPG